MYICSSKTAESPLKYSRLPGRGVRRAAKKNIKVSQSLINDTFAKAKTFPFGTKTSFQRDFEKAGKKDERDQFGGAVIRMGVQAGVKTPVTERIYASIQARKTI